MSFLFGMDIDKDYLHIYEEDKKELIDFVLSQYEIKPLRVYNNIECDGKSYRAIVIPIRHKHIFDRDILIYKNR